MRTPHQLKPSRPGFTLIEVLVVIAILSILLGLVGAGIVAVIGSQRQANTKATMQAVNKILVRQIKFVVDKADKEVIPSNVIILAAGDEKLARVIWKKLRLKQEFPMTFAEAVAPYNSCAYAFVSPPPTTIPPTPLLPSDLPALPNFTAALKNAGIAQQDTATGIWSINSGRWANWQQSTAQGQPFIESSVCLLLALQQNRGGASLKAEDLGAAAVPLRITNLDPARAVDVLAMNNSGLKMLVDGWGVEMAFFRFPTSNDDITSPGLTKNDDLDKQNPAPAGSAAATYRDPYDPQGLLVNPNWNNMVNWSGQLGVYWFEQLGHVVHTPNASGYPTPPASTSPWPRYMLPTLVSAGRDGKWGLNSMFNTSPPYNGYYVAGVNPDMSIQPNNAAVDSNDNIYSYRLGSE